MTFLLSISKVLYSLNCKRKSNQYVDYSKMKIEKKDENDACVFLFFFFISPIFTLFLLAATTQLQSSLLLYFLSNSYVTKSFDVSTYGGSCRGIGKRRKKSC